MASLSDILSTLQNGVVAINNFGLQMKGTLNNIRGTFMTILNPYFLGSLTGRSVNADIELGAADTANTPLIDFHSSGNNIDYDARILATGGSAVLGQGTIAITAATVALSGDLTWVGSAWTAFTPTLTPLAGAYTTASASGRYKVLGKTVVVTVLITITTIGTGTYPLITLPVSPLDIATVILSGAEVALTGLAITARDFTATQLVVARYDNNSPAANGMVIKLSGTYEAA